MELQLTEQMARNLYRFYYPEFKKWPMWPLAIATVIALIGTVVTANKHPSWSFWLTAAVVLWIAAFVVAFRNDVWWVKKTKEQHLKNVVDEVVDRLRAQEMHVDQIIYIDWGLFCGIQVENPSALLADKQAGLYYHLVFHSDCVSITAHVGKQIPVCVKRRLKIENVIVHYVPAIHRSLKTAVWKQLGKDVSWRPATLEGVGV